MAHPLKPLTMTRRFTLTLFSATLCAATWSAAQGTKADYERAEALAQRIENKVFRQRISPTWLPGNTRFWYRVDTGPGTAEFVLVDAEAGTRSHVFDHAAVAAALTAAGVEAAPDRLPFRSIGIADDGAIRFHAGGRSWTWSAGAGLAPAGDAGVEDSNRTSRMPIRFRRSRNGGERVTIAFVNELPDPVELVWIDSDGGRHGYGLVDGMATRELSTWSGHVWLLNGPDSRPLAVIQTPPEGGAFIIDGPGRPAGDGERDGPPRGRRGEPRGGGMSPDGTATVFVQDHNIFLRRNADGREQQISTNGSESEYYSPFIRWAPDSRHFVALRVRKGSNRSIHMVESSPEDQLQPRLHVTGYLKPGDELPKPVPVIFSADGRSQRIVDDSLFPNPFTETGDLDIRWSPDSREFLFVYNQRGHQLWRIIAVDAATGATRTVVEETSDTFIDYSGKTSLHWLDQTGELLWMSERDGRAHLYLCDVATGTLKCQVTKGDYIVRRVESVDESARQVWFLASSLRPEESPYHVHLCRVNLDGSGFVRLTEGDGTHRITFSPDRRWFIDQWSRVDHPPVHELRESATGRLVCELERADWSALLAAGWTVPERIVARGRDGVTDIHGILIRPSNPDPDRKWPVLEQVYAGPHSAHVPVAFDLLTRAHVMAEHGFIWVQADGMGTNHRGKKFHDVCWKNLADAGFPDRIAWIRAAAATRPWMDLTRVGIYGGSAGGQNAMRALLDHHDFYSAAAADCGCHDNRMDKIWWNEQWMGWPVDESYARSSNVEHAARLKGHLLLTVGELDKNVDPASTYQVVNALIRANKPFEFLMIPGAGHGVGETPYAARRRIDFFVRHLHGVTPPPP